MSRRVNAAPETPAEKSTPTVRERLLAVAAQLNRTFVGRKDAIEAIVLAHVAGEHYLLIGDRGTGKTAVASCFVRHVTGARVFRVLLGSFTTPEKVFGPLDVRAFQAGHYKTVTAGMLPDCDLAFQDEVMKAPDGTLCEEMGVLNEREFQGEPIPLHCCGAATNWPEVDGRSARVQPLYDRFLLRVSVRELEDEGDVALMLAAADGVRAYEPAQTVTMDELRAAAAEARTVEVPDWARLELAKLRTRLAVPKRPDGTPAATGGVRLSARRVAQMQGVMRASAWLDGRQSVTVADFAALRFGLWEDRRDLEAVESALANIDHEAVQEAIKVCETARKQMRDADGQTVVGNATSAQVIKVAVDATAVARGYYEGPRLTKAGKERVLGALLKLREDIEGFARRHPDLWGEELPATAQEGA